MLAWPIWPSARGCSPLRPPQSGSRHVADRGSAALPAPRPRPWPASRSWRSYVGTASPPYTPRNTRPSGPDSAKVSRWCTSPGTSQTGRATDRTPAPVLGALITMRFPISTADRSIATDADSRRRASAARPAPRVLLRAGLAPAFCGRGDVTQGRRAAGARARGACTRPAGCGRRRSGARSSRGRRPGSRRRCVLRPWPR